MRAAGSPPQDRTASTSTWLVAAAVVTAAGTVLALAPPDAGRPEPGDVVNYSEDKVGRPWRIVRQHEFGRYVIKNGRVAAIADLDEISPYKGLSKEATVQMAGPHWKGRLAKIRAQQHVAVQDGLGTRPGN